MLVACGKLWWQQQKKVQSWTITKLHERRNRLKRSLLWHWWSVWHIQSYTAIFSDSIWVNRKRKCYRTYQGRWRLCIRDLASHFLHFQNWWTNELSVNEWLRVLINMNADKICNVVKKASCKPTQSLIVTKRSLSTSAKAWWKTEQGKNGKITTLSQWLSLTNRWYGNDHGGHQTIYEKKYRIKRAINT